MRLPSLRSTTRLRRLSPSRLKVVGPAFACGAALCGLLALGGASKADWGLLTTAFVWASSLTGPFAGLWFTSTWGPIDAAGWAVGSVAAIVAHPLRAGWLTGTISAAGVALWILLGLGLTYDGV